MKVRCTREPSGSDGSQDGLTVGQPYVVLAIEAGDYRILNDWGDPVLYTPEVFEVTDARRPADWVESIEDGEPYASPPEFHAPGFWEDYHDRKPEALRTFARYINERLGQIDAA